MLTKSHGPTLKSKEPQYQFEVDMALRDGFSRFGFMSNQTWKDDPRRLLFLLSRYKFVAKMLSGKKRVVEIGCTDAFGTRLVSQEGCRVTACDFDPVFIEDAQARMQADGWACDTRVHDILTGPVPPGDFDAAYTLDVFEHIVPEKATTFVGNIARSLCRAGVARQTLVSLAVFFVAHVPSGLSTALAAGLVGGFYFAFTYVFWRRAAWWTAFWVTAASHFLHNAIAVALMLMLA